MFIVRNLFYCAWKRIFLVLLKETFDTSEICILNLYQISDDGMDVKTMLESMTASMLDVVLKEKKAHDDIEKIAHAGKGAAPFEIVECISDLITSSKLESLAIFLQFGMREGNILKCLNRKKNSLQYCIHYKLFLKIYICPQKMAKKIIISVVMPW